MVSCHAQAPGSTWLYGILAPVRAILERYGSYPTCSLMVRGCSMGGQGMVRECSKHCAFPEYTQSMFRQYFEHTTCILLPLYYNPAILPLPPDYRSLAYFTSLFSSSSNDTPFVSGTWVSTQISCSTIIKAKNAKIGQGSFPKTPFSLSRKTGTINAITAAKTQCTLAPKDCPVSLTLLGKISAMNTHITAPCPTACDAINIKRKVIKNPGPALA